MKRSIVFILCIGLLCGFTNSPTGYKLQSDKAAVFSTVPFGNDYTKDASCQLAWLLNTDNATQPDATGKGRTGAIGGLAVYTASGKFGGAYDCETSTSDYLYDSSNVGLEGVSQCTLMCYIKFESIGDRWILTQWGGTQPERVIGIAINDTNTVQCSTGNGSATLNSTADYTGTFSTGAWYHIAVTYNAGNGKLYVNGIYQAAFSGLHTSLNASATSNFVAMSDSTGTACTDGVIDECAVFSRELSASEILAISSKGLVQ